MPAATTRSSTRSAARRSQATAAASMRCVAGSPRSTRRRAWWWLIPPQPMKSPPTATAATARSPALLKRLKEPGLEIEQLFRRVAADVNAQTGGRQRPETYVSLLSNYYLNQTDRIAFDKVKDSPDSAPLLDFVAKFPTSSY